MENNAKNKNKEIWYIAWALIIVGALVATTQAMKPKGLEITWRRVAMDGHFSGVKPLSATNLDVALGTFSDSGYVAPSGKFYAKDTPMYAEASLVLEAQSKMAEKKKVIGHSARVMSNDRDNPDLPLGNLFVDVMRAYASKYFKQPMDFAITNFGGIRVPMPEGEILQDDIESMLPFKNYLCFVKMKGENLTKLFEQLSGTTAFQPISGATVRVKDHKLESALVGGKPIDPKKEYNVATIDFLLDGGDQLRIGALADKVTLSHVLLKEIMLDYVKDCEAKGIVIDSQPDGRVVMED
jgi:2',3'-cyclic-nucleotide 2'-phosphodiesterase (5'-nucleotidase family)